jgi:1-acyl-sn-glycerol-3-phosphate acyltransferase
MWTDSCVLPDRAVRSTRAAAPATRVRLQSSLRLLRLARVVLQLYFHARAARARPRADGRTDVQRWARRVVAAVGIELRVRGHVVRPDAPLLVVANHVSWLDSYLLNTVTTARFVAKSEVAGWPVIGTIARAFATVFLRRGSCRAAARVAAALADALATGVPVAAFPESTTSDGNGLLPFYPAMFQAAVWSGARVQPVAIRYRDAAGRRTDAPAYVGDMSVLDSLRRVIRAPHICAELIFCAPLDPTGRTRRELAALAHRAIASALADGSDALAPAPLRRAA